MNMPLQLNFARIVRLLKIPVNPFAALKGIVTHVSHFACALRMIDVI